MPELHPHEDAVVRKFLTHDHRLTFLRGLSGSPKVRVQTLSGLCHFYDWVDGTEHVAPRSERRPEGVYRLLREKGPAKVCHVVAFLNVYPLCLTVHSLLLEFVR